jgi:hypothetical protein
MICFYHDYREGTKTMHYIINKIEEDGETPRYKIGSNFFESMPTLLRHYTTHYLDTTQLLKPVIKFEVLHIFEFLFLLAFKTEYNVN